MNQMNQIKATQFIGKQNSLIDSPVYIKTRTNAFKNEIYCIR